MNSWIINLITMIIKTASPELRAQIAKSINEWEVKAKQTKSPWDDILVNFVKAIVGI